MIDKTEAQPEALRLAAWLKEGAWHQMRLGDVEAAGRELRRQYTEIQQLKAREHELEQMHDHSNLVVDAAKEHIASLEAQLSARQAAPGGREPIETVKYWRDAYANPQGDKHFMGHGMVVKIMDDHLAMLSAPPNPTPATQAGAVDGRENHWHC